MVVAASSPSEGLEVGIPRSSWYARGVALDMQGRWDESYNAYREALREFVEQLRARPAWSRMIRGWILKAEYLKDQSERLRYPLYRFGPPSAALLYQRGLAKHNKWLAIRAFTGRSEEGLVREVIDDYQRTLLQSPGYDSARLALASLYHEIGQHSRGRQEFARVQDVSRSWMAVEVAYYYTTAGEVERALESLDRAVQYNEGNKRHALRSNNFDRLRSLPRFRAVVGEP